VADYQLCEHIKPGAVNDMQRICRSCLVEHGQQGIFFIFNGSAVMCRRGVLVAGADASLFPKWVSVLSLTNFPYSVELRTFLAKA
jgi:hypothetical protein